MLCASVQNPYLVYEQVLRRRMQSPTQSNPSPEPVATATTQNQPDREAEAPPEQSEPDTQEQESKSTETGTIQQENGSDRESAASTEFKEASEHEPAAQQQTQLTGQAGGTELDSASKPSLPSDPVDDLGTSTGCDSLKVKNKAKCVLEGKKYVMSKKAMIDPLKIDMTKPLPLSCEYYTL